MRGARSSVNLLRSLVRNSAVSGDGGAKGGFDFVGSLLRIAATEEGQWLKHQQWHILSSRSISSDAPKPPPGEEEPESELGRWWQKFSEQSRAQAGNSRKTNKDSGEKQWSILKGEELAGQEPRDPSSREGGSKRWFIPELKVQLGEEKPESLDKEAISRWFLPKDPEASSTEQERQEITSKEVGARWLASSKEKSSTELELPDLSSAPWFSLNKETPASERERLEVSMQRLALMSKMGDNNQASNFTFLPPKNELLRKYFHWENLASPEKHKVTLTKVRNDFQIHKTDCGSSQVQIALLTTKIKYMTKHMETHRKDYHSRKGLEAMVQRRRKILKYLRRKDWDAYCEMSEKFDGLDLGSKCCLMFVVDPVLESKQIFQDSNTAVRVAEVDVDIRLICNLSDDICTKKAEWQMAIISFTVESESEVEKRFEMYLLMGARVGIELSPPFHKEPNKISPPKTQQRLRISELAPVLVKPHNLPNTELI